MLFKYILTDSQYNRFQHATNDEEIRNLCKSAGCEVTNEQLVNNIETWYFKGRCAGTMALVKCSPTRIPVRTFHSSDHWECWINIRSKPWWLPYFILF